jgi:hypothetical protein
MRTADAPVGPTSPAFADSTADFTSAHVLPWTQDAKCCTIICLCPPWLLPNGQLSPFSYRKARITILRAQPGLTLLASPVVQWITSKINHAVRFPPRQSQFLTVSGQSNQTPHTHKHICWSGVHKSPPSTHFCWKNIIFLARSPAHTQIQTTFAQNC